MLDPYDLETPESSLDTLRLWISDQQWMAILEDVERAAEDRERGGEGRLQQRVHPRFPGQFQCIVRLGAPDAPAGGTLLVRTRNISAGGIGFLHGQPLPSNTRCTVALHAQDALGQNHGLITAGRVAWCREIQQQQVFATAYEIGVQFEKTVEIGPFVEDDEIA